MSSQPVEKKRLGELLISQGLITEDHLRIALEEQKKHGGRLGIILVRLGFISAERLVAFLKENLNVGLKEEGTTEQQSAVAALPRQIALYYKIAPLKKEGSTLTIAVPEKENPKLIHALTELTGLQIDPLIYPESQIRYFHERLYKLPSEKGIHLIHSGFNVFVIADKENGLKPLAISQLKNERDAGEWLRSVIAEAIKEKSREILIKPGPESASVFFRKDTFFLSEYTIKSEIVEDLGYLLIRLSKMNPGEKQEAQYGHFQIRVHGRHIMMVVAMFPTIFGMRFTLEFFNEQMLKHTFNETAAPFPQLLQQLEAFIFQPHQGMIVITGPDSSGRTSFFYGLLSWAKEYFRHVTTLENAIHYPLNGVTQKLVEESRMEEVLDQVKHERQGLIAINSLRSPRSVEQAFLITARTPTIGVLHSYDSFLAIEWMCKNNLKSAIKAGLVRMIISPRLIRRVCQNCAIPYDLQKERDLRHGGKVQAKVNQGCEFCKDLDSSSAQFVIESLQVDTDLINWISADSSAVSLRRRARAAGKETLLDLAMPGALKGELDILSVLKLRSVETTA